MARLIVMAILGASLFGCGDSGDDQTVSAVVDVACGSCIYGLDGPEGCEWAAEIDGEHLYLMGAVPQNHDGHAPDGICSMERQAQVEGVIRDGKLVVTDVQLIPAENVPTTAHEHTHEH